MLICCIPVLGSRLLSRCLTRATGRLSLRIGALLLFPTVALPLCGQAAVLQHALGVLRPNCIGNAFVLCFARITYALSKRRSPFAVLLCCCVTDVGLPVEPDFTPRSIYLSFAGLLFGLWIASIEACLLHTAQQREQCIFSRSASGAARSCTAIAGATTQAISRLNFVRRR